MTERLLARAIIGPMIPVVDDITEIPEPYRTTVLQRRALLMAGSQPVEPSEVVTPPITEEPT